MKITKDGVKKLKHYEIKYIIKKHIGYYTTRCTVNGKYSRFASFNEPKTVRDFIYGIFGVDIRENSAMAYNLKFKDMLYLSNIKINNELIVSKKTLDDIKKKGFIYLTHHNYPTNGKGIMVRQKNNKLIYETYSGGVLKPFPVKIDDDYKLNRIEVLDRDDYTILHNSLNSLKIHVKKVKIDGVEYVVGVDEPTKPITKKDINRMLRA